MGSAFWTEASVFISEDIELFAISFVFYFQQYILLEAASWRMRVQRSTHNVGYAGKEALETGGNLPPKSLRIAGINRSEAPRR